MLFCRNLYYTGRIVFCWTRTVVFVKDPWYVVRFTIKKYKDCPTPPTPTPPRPTPTPTPRPPHPTPTPTATATPTPTALRRHQPQRRRQQLWRLLQQPPTCNAYSNTNPDSNSNANSLSVRQTDHRVFYVGSFEHSNRCHCRRVQCGEWIYH